MRFSSGLAPGTIGALLRLRVQRCWRALLFFFFTYFWRAFQAALTQPGKGALRRPRFPSSPQSDGDVMALSADSPGGLVGRLSGRPCRLVGEAAAGRQFPGSVVGRLAADLRSLVADRAPWSRVASCAALGSGLRSPVADRAPWSRVASCAALGSGLRPRPRRSPVSGCGLRRWLVGPSPANFNGLCWPIPGWGRVRGTWCVVPCCWRCLCLCGPGGVCASAVLGCLCLCGPGGVCASVVLEVSVPLWSWRCLCLCGPGVSVPLWSWRCQCLCGPRGSRCLCLCFSLLLEVSVPLFLPAAAVFRCPF